MHQHHNPKLTRNLLISIVLNILIAGVQVFFGIWARSLSLLADALHNTSDVVSLAISLWANHLSRKKCTPEETFGYKRAEILAAFINAGALLIIAILIIKEAVVRFWEPADVNPVPVMILAVLSVFINGGCAYLLHKDAGHNSNVNSSYLHLLSDMFTSFAVFAGGLAMYFWDVDWLDSILSMLVSVYLFYVAWVLVLKTIKVLMHFTPDHLDIDVIEQSILAQCKKIKNIHHVHLWRLNDYDIHFEAHVDFSEDMNLSEVTKNLTQIQRTLFEEFGINHITLQPEIGRLDDKDLVFADEHDHR